MLHTFGMEGTKWNIFKQAVELFATNGYHAVSMKNIAKAADIKSASIYNHFESKEEILLTMYEFYDHYFAASRPKLEELLEELDNKPPGEVLLKLANQMDSPEMDEFMNKIFTIATVQMFSDPRAKDLIVKNMFEVPRKYFVPLFDKLVADGKAKSADVESFLLLHSSLYHSTTLMTTAQTSISWDSWLKCHKFLIDSTLKM